MQHHMQSPYGSVLVESGSLHPGHCSTHRKRACAWYGSNRTPHRSQPERSAVRACVQGLRCKGPPERLLLQHEVRRGGEGRGTCLRARARTPRTHTRRREGRRRIGLLRRGGGGAGMRPRARSLVGCTLQAAALLLAGRVQASVRERYQRLLKAHKAKVGEPSGTAQLHTWRQPLLAERPAASV